MDGVITDKEREVIFRKSKELGVPEDECEIILESMTFKNNDNKKDSNNSEESIDETSQKEIKVNNEKDSKDNTNDIIKSKTTEDKQHTHPSNEHTNIKRNDKNKESGKVDFSNFISVHSSKKGVFGRRFILDLEKTFKSINNKWYVEDKVREVIEPLKDKVIFKFSHSFVVGEDFLISVESGKKIPLLKVNDFELKDGKTFSKSGFFLDDEWFGDFFSMDNEGGKELFYLFKKYINENLENDKSKNENNNQKSDNEKISNKDDDKELEKDLTFDDEINVELEKQEPDDINWESLNISSFLKSTIELCTYSGSKLRKSELKSIYDISDREGIQREEILVIIEKMINLSNQRKEKKLREENKKREDKKQEFLKLITIENITNKKSKFYEILYNEQVELQQKYKDGFLEYKLETTSRHYQKRIFFNLLKLEVFNTIFKKNFFHPKRLTNLKNILNKFHEVHLPSIHGDDFGNYIDKNGFLFNPVTGYLVFYIDDNNIFKYELEKVKSLSSLPFYKGGLLTKPGIKLKETGYKDGLHIGIKSKYFKETGETYKNWVKFLFTLEDFKTDFTNLRKEKLLLKTNQLHEFLDDLDWKWELKKHVTEVKGILNSKKKEIESKEKEFNSNFIQDFIKIINFVESNIENYYSMNIRMCSQIDIYIKKEKFLDYDEIEKITESHNKFISLNSTIIFGLIEMIRSVIYNDRIRFYEIYEKFDKLRIFNSQYQNDVINSLSSINQNLVDLNSKIDNLTNTIEMMSDQILSSINELQFEVSYLNDNITGQLQNISSKLDVNNLLNMVQTYQLYRINSNTKSLRS